MYYRSPMQNKGGSIAQFKVPFHKGSRNKSSNPPPLLSSVKPKTPTEDLSWISLPEVLKCQNQKQDYQI